MYVLYVTVLTVGVYLAPGLALMPRAAFDSRLACAVPIVSVLLVTGLARTLKLLGVFTETTVLVIALAVTAVAVGRVWLIRNRTRFYWPNAHRLIYLISLCIALFSAAKLGVSSFDGGDEIYSWNLWAIQHTRGEPPDLFYTQAPYPQTFSYLIAWCYQLLHSIDLQPPVKCSLAVFTVSMLAAIGTAARGIGSRSLVCFIVLAIVAMAATGVRSAVTAGLAEVLMIPALVVSVALYLHWRRCPGNLAFLWLASGSAVVAGLSKQPALLWLMLVFPVLVAVGRRPRDKAALIPVALAVLAGVVWLLTEGAGFLDNRGVIEDAQKNRDGLEQILFAVQRFLIGKPPITVLLVLAGYCVLRERFARGVYFGLIIPLLVLWLVFGAYATRLGAHVMALSALVIAANDYWPGAHWRTTSAEISTRVRRFAHGVLATATILSGIYAWDTYNRRGSEFSFYDGGKNTIYRYFGEGSGYIYNEVYKSDSTLWIPSNYIYGIFYSHNPVIRPAGRWQDYDAAHIRTSILRDRPDYLFDPGIITPSSMATNFREFLRRCKDWFDIVASPPNLFNYTVYRLKTDAVNRNQECSR